MARNGARTAASYLLLVLLLEYATSSPLNLPEGSRCPSSPASTCRRVRHCPPAIEAIQQRRPLPQRCGFSGFEEIVCCPDQRADIMSRDMDIDADADVGANDIPTGDDFVFPVDQRPSVRPSVAACSSYKDKMAGLEDYILNGRMAGEQELPHMAALGFNVPNMEGISWLCGGTLISDQFVLTAAHCCANRVAGRPVRVRLGVNDLTATAGGADYGISEIILHPSYRSRQYHSDIALLKLDRRVEFSDAVFPACLNKLDGDPSSYTAAGWGATDPLGTLQSSTLLKTTIYPYAVSKCQNAFKEKFPKGMDSSLICAGDPRGKSDTCLGDSGAPLVTGRSAPYTAFGVTSMGARPCGGIMPSMYTRISHFLDWIEEHVWR